MHSVPGKHVQDIIHERPRIGQFAAAESGEHLVFSLRLREDFGAQDVNEMERFSAMDSESGMQTGRTYLRF